MRHPIGGSVVHGDNVAHCQFKPGTGESGVTVGAFPCYLTRVPELGKNREIVGGKLGEKGNRVERRTSEAG